MAIDKRKAKENLFASLPPIFRDDVTGDQPQNETELTAVLGVLHQRRVVRWDSVPLYSPAYESSRRFADALFADGGIMVCEYPMFCRSRGESVWGSMKADLVYLSGDRQTVVAVENKIGSEFTSGGNDVETGQLARQIEYLNQSRITQPHLVLLSTGEFFEAKWYSSELLATLRHKTHCARVQAHLIKWEDVLEAVPTVP